MARWSESRGYTLVLTHPRGPDRYARIVLVNKRTLFGLAYNVREARAEDVTRSGQEPEGLGLGRMLSWRWLGEGEAQELISARLRTLEALGYSVLGEAQAESRGPWDWLRELVTRQLERQSQEGEAREGASEAQAADADSHDADATETLRESLERLGLEPDAVIEGISTILEVDPATLREPSADSLRALDPELLVMLLPVWLEHDSDELQAIGRRWLALPATPYELDVTVLERWAGGEGLLALALAPRLEREGLALLGPSALGRLAQTAAEPRVKSIATHWRSRLRPPVRAAASSRA